MLKILFLYSLLLRENDLQGNLFTKKTEVSEVKDIIFMGMYFDFS
jgi:hypothetical protein